MPRAERGSTKDVANRMKSKGLQKLRWYCQVCEKQCRDENGFKCHAMTESHLRQMLVVGESAGKYINSYSEDFKRDFVALLSRRWGTKRVRVNQVYQEFISDKSHSHMNATRWVTLTEFVKYLGREGVVHADETEKGWFVSWIDNTPKALSRQAATMAKERADMDDEQRMRKLIEEQIEKAAKEKGNRGQAGVGVGVRGSGDDGEKEKEKEPERVLERDEGAAPITLSFGPKKEPDLPSASTSTTPSATKPATGLSFSAKPNPFKTNPLKRPAPTSNNPLKSNPLKSTSTTSGSSSKGKAPMSAMEAIILEEQERKKRKDAQTWSGDRGHGAEGLQVKKQRM